MQPNYSSQGAEHVERIEESSSSSGWQTQPLQSSGQFAAMTPQTGRRSNNFVALLLIGLGLVIFLGRFIPDSEPVMGGMVLLTIASCFLFFAFWRRIYGLLIPGSILAGLSLGVPFAELTNGVSVLWGLALGFLAIALVGRSFFGVRTQWSIIPAVPLFGVGVIVAMASLPLLFSGGLTWLPLLLIAAGLYLGWGRRTT